MPKGELEAGVAAALTTEVTRAGRRLRIRPIQAADKELMRAGFAAMSPESRARRFLGSVKGLSPRVLRYFTEVDYLDHFAVVVLDLDDGARAARAESSDGEVGREVGREVGVAFGRYIRLRDRTSAEMALAVVDSHQGLGLGSLVRDVLVGSALAAGVSTFVATVRSDNAPMLALLRGARRRTSESGIVTYDCDLRELAAACAPEVVGFYRRAGGAALRRCATAGEAAPAAPSVDV